MPEILPFELSIVGDDPRGIALAHEYWNLVDGAWERRVRDIADEAGLKRRELLALVRANAEVRVPSLNCRTCGAVPEANSRNRLEGLSRYPNGFTCDECRERTNAEFRRRFEQMSYEKPTAPEAPSDEKREKLERWPLYVRHYLPPSRRVPDVSAYSLERTVALLALIRGGTTNWPDTIRPIEDFVIPFTPSDELSRELVSDLLEAGFISFHPETDPDSIFSLHDDGRVERYFPIAVQWRLNVGGGSDKIYETQEFLRSLLDDESMWPRGWVDDTGALWRKIAKHDVAEFFEAKLRAHGLFIEDKERVLTTVEGLLAHYSVAQSYNFAWQAAEKAAAFMVRQGAAKLHASRYALKTFSGRAERATAQGWEVKAYRRDYSLPESIVWKVSPPQTPAGKRHTVLGPRRGLGA